MLGIKFRILFSSLTILGLIGAVNTVFAASVVERPIEDWLKNNPLGGRWLTGKYVACFGANPMMDFSALPGGVGILPAPNGGEAGHWDSILAMVEDETITTGRILEKTMPDGRAEITIEINVKNGPLTIYRFDELLAYANARKADPDNEELLNNPPEPVLGDREDGSIDYKQLVKITNPTPDMEIGVIYQYAFGLIPGGNLKVWTSPIGMGSGTFTDHAADFVDLNADPGTTGIVSLPGTHPVGD